MRSSDLFYGLFAAMAVFLSAAVFAAGFGGGVLALLLLIAGIALFTMRSRSEGAPQVLLVGPDGPARDLLDGAFDMGGYAVASCAGPGARPCPVLEGRPCPVPAHPSATVALLADAAMPVPPCQRHFHVPTVAVEDGWAGPRSGAAERVSWDDGPQAAVNAVRELVS